MPVTDRHCFLYFRFQSIRAVRQHHASLFHIAVDIVHYRSYAVSDLSAFYRARHLDPPVEIALHEIGRRNIHDLIYAFAENVNS